MLEIQGTSAASVEQPVLERLMLIQALGQLGDRERYKSLLWKGPSGSRTEIIDAAFFSTELRIKPAKSQA